MSLLGISKKGKWIVGGVALFAVIATASTGLAAWVIGENKGAEDNGTITVEKTITDKSISLKIGENCDLDVNFGPKNGSFPVVNATDTNTNEEDLSFTVSGTISLANESTPITKVTAILKLDTNAQTLVTNGYIVAPGTATGNAGEYELADCTLDKSAKTFTGTYSFTWGEKFKVGETNVNPCVFYDGSVGKGYAEAKTALEALAKVTDGTFTVTLSVE